MARDQYWNNVVLAMHMDDTGLTDAKGHAVSLVGNVARSATQSKAGGYSASFDGTGDYISIPASTDFSFGSGDFCLDCWVWIPSTPAENKSLINRRLSGQATGFSYVMYIDASAHLAVMFSYNGTTTPLSVISAQTISANAWHHLRINRSGATIRLFIDGVLDSNTGNIGANSLFASSSALSLGGNLDGSRSLLGYLDDVEITKGSSREITSFTPVAPFPDQMIQVSGIVKDVSGALTSKPVHVHRQSDGALAGIATSNATTGAFSIDALDASAHYATCIYSDTEPAITHHNIIPV